jgi:hypothetical protein
MFALLIAGSTPAPVTAQDIVKDTKERFEKAKSIVSYDKETITVRAHDLDNAKDTIFELRLDAKNKDRAIKVLVGPRPKNNVLAANQPEIEISVGKPLLAEFAKALDAVGRDYPDLGKRLKDMPLDLRGNLALAEEKLGLDKIRGDASLVERVWRLTWTEGVNRVADKNVTLTFTK